MSGDTIRDIHSFPTRRSSDLCQLNFFARLKSSLFNCFYNCLKCFFIRCQVWCKSTDRKSTRLNSSHVASSYAVFCLKKKWCRSEEHTSELQSRYELVCRHLHA